MLEESASAIPSSLWASMNSWFTPSVLFLLLNLMIGTIAFTSTFANQKQHHHQQQKQQHSHDDKHSQNDYQNQPTIARSPSLLQRLKSINFHTHYRSQETAQDSSLHHTQNLENTFQSQHFEAQANYFFSQENGDSVHHSQPYVFSQTHQENSMKNETHFDFEQKDSNFDGFSQTHKENSIQSQTHFDFEQKDSIFDSFSQTHEQNSIKSETHFDFKQKDSIFDDFQMAHEEKIEGESEQSMDDVYSQLTGSHFSRTKSDTEPTSGEFPTKLPARMRKSASAKSVFGHFEEEEIVEALRPATVRERGNAKVTDVDEGVDAKADDFINRFKQQLQLQRLDSIIRGRRT